MKTTLALRAAFAAFAFTALVARAGGPLTICNSAAVKYPGNGSVALSYDQGALGSRTKAQADAIVTAGASLWTNVTTATITLSRTSNLPIDVTSSNYGTYFNQFTDGINPVIYDTDGSIIDTILGTGQKSFVLGFAGSAAYGPPTCQYAEGQAVLNGYISVPDATLTNVVAHELGHLIGLDHTQLDSSQGLASSNYPLMYPVAYRTTSTLHVDDVAAVTALYPDTTVATSYGTLSGNFTLANGATVAGANIWAQDVNNPTNVFSVVSDYLKQGTGYFKLMLPPGTYTLHAQAIESGFTGGSSVGPYSETSTDLSFQSPLYVGGTPMAPLTFGNAAPIRITIVAGCAATVAFHFDGSGSVSGNCGPSVAPPTRLFAVSTRLAVLTGDDVAIAGFIVGGSTNKTVVIRARGPSLAQAGITNPLANPTLTLVRASDNSIIATNDNWGSAPNAAQISASGYAPSSSFESAILTSLPPGAYTAIVSGVGGTTGVGIAEVYEIDTPQTPLTGISTRGEVLTGNNVMIGGFVIQGSTPQTVVIRARGPSLAQAGIVNPLANPTLTLVDASGSVVATNDDWGTAPNSAQISASGFAPSDPHESAILVTLAPGSYTGIVSGVGGGTGVGIVEIYNAQ